MLRIGLLTSGGDCQALNATMRGVVKGLANNVKDLEAVSYTHLTLPTISRVYVAGVAGAG